MAGCSQGSVRSCMLCGGRLTAPVLGFAAKPPSERIQFLLGQNDDDHQTHDVFCEMGVLRQEDSTNEYEWKEAARWVKFEEVVEEGGDRWSKPHVATLSLHSLFELRKGMLSGTVMLDCEAYDIYSVAGACTLPLFTLLNPVQV